MADPISVLNTTLAVIGTVLIIIIPLVGYYLTQLRKFKKTGIFLKSRTLRRSIKKKRALSGRLFIGAG